MKNYFIFIFAVIFMLTLTCFKKVSIKRDTDKDAVTADYTMAERAIDWLEFINAGADNGAIRQYFMKEVAPTKGCKSIIHHWRRFMKWDKDQFFKFVMEALNKIPTDEPVKNEDGSLTGLGTRRELWLSALANPGNLRKDIENLKKINLKDTSLIIAKKYLPDDAIVSNDFFIVLFGGSSAFSVGKENGFDLLQLPKGTDGAIDVEEVIETFAHEMHHTGFSYCNKKYMTDVKKGKNIQLIGVLAAEGMPTYFINKTQDDLEKYKTSLNKLQQDVAQDWESHLARLPQLYIEAEKDIGLNLNGEIGQKEIFEKWMSGVQGPAYVLGADMFSVIDKYMGVDAAKPIAHDYRQFLVIYNRAAQKANKEGENFFVFNEELTNKVVNYTGR